MANRTVRLKKSADVRTLSKDVWIVEKQGISRARSRRVNGAGFATQAQAEDAARKAVKCEGGGEVIVHSRDGKLRAHDTHPATDPHPPSDTKR